MTLDSLKHEGRTLPSRDDAACALHAAPTMHSWPAVHARAQVDGMLYSFRLLRQVLEVLNYADGFQNCLVVEDVDYLALMTLLREMPSLVLLMQASVGLPMGDTSPSDGGGVLAHFYPLASDGDFEVLAANGKRERRKRRRTIRAITTRSNAGRSTGSSNKFEVLRRD